MNANYRNKFDGKISHPPSLSGSREQMDRQILDYTHQMGLSLSSDIKKEFQSLKDFVGTVIINRGGVSGGGGSVPAVGSLLVRNVSNSYNQTGIGSLNFDDSDGIVLTPDGVGGTRIDLSPSTLAPYFSPYRAGTNSITTAGTAILFSSAIPASTVFVKPTKCSNGSGDVGVTISAVTTTGFIATPLENATLEWRAQASYLPIPVYGYLTSSNYDLFFGMDLGTTDYIVDVITCQNATGEQVGVSSISKSSDHITLTPIEDALVYCNIYYYA